MTRWASSRAAPSRMRMPLSAPLPVPTMIAVGVARPIAHGQAMIRTAIAVDSANGRLGAGPEEEPDREGECRHGDDGGHEPTGDPVRQSLDRRLRALRAFDEADDLGQGRVRPDPLGAHHERPARVEGRPDHAVAGGLVDRDRLAGEHRLVHRGRPVDHDAIDGNPIAGPHPQQVADDDLADGHVALATRAQDACGRRPQLEEAAHGTRGLTLGAGLEPSSEQDEADDQRGRVEVRLVAEPGRHHRLRQEGDDDRVGVRGKRADRDEGVHVRLAVAGASRRGDEEASPEDELDDRGGDQEPAVDVGHRPRRAAGPEHDRHHHASDDQRCGRLEEELATLGGALELGGIDVGGRIPGGIAAHVVAGGLDGRDDSGSVDDRGIEAHRGPLRREVDGRVTDAIGARQVALDPVDAARAGHADDRNAELCGRNRGGWRAHRCSQDTTGEYRSPRATKR